MTEAGPLASKRLHNSEYGPEEKSRCVCPAVGVVSNLVTTPGQGFSISLSHKTSHGLGGFQQPRLALKGLMTYDDSDDQGTGRGL